MITLKEIFLLFYQPKNHFDRIKTRDFLQAYVAATRNHKIKRDLEYKWEDFICVPAHNPAKRKLRQFCLELSRQFHDANPEESNKTQDFRYYSATELDILSQAIALLSLTEADASDADICDKLDQLATQHHLGNLDD